MSNIHERLVLFTVQAYLENSIKEGLTKEDLHYRIVSGISSYKMMRRFSEDELKTVRELGEHEYMQNLKDIQISHIVYALELLKLLVDDGYKFHIGVSMRKLKMGRATFAIDMLKLKDKNIDDYEKTKAIIDESVVVAKQFFYYTQEQLKAVK